MHLLLHCCMSRGVEAGTRNHPCATWCVPGLVPGAGPAATRLHRPLPASLAFVCPPPLCGCLPGVEGWGQAIEVGGLHMCTDCTRPLWLLAAIPAALNNQARADGRQSVAARQAHCRLCLFWVLPSCVCVPKLVEGCGWQEVEGAERATGVSKPGLHVHV